MKEFEVRPPERPVSPKGGLTGKHNNLTLRSEVTFMAEHSEGPKPPQAERPVVQASVRPPLTPEQEENYERIIADEKDPDAKETYRIMKAERINAPIQGAAIDPESEEEERMRAAGWIGEEPPAMTPEELTGLRNLLIRGGLDENLVNSFNEMQLRSLAGMMGPRARAETEEEEIPGAGTLMPEERRLLRNSSYRLYLEPEDILGLYRDPISWLDKQFDILYRSVQEGQELTSPVINQLQSTVGYAIRFVQYHATPDKLDEFQTLFTRRLKLMTMRTYIGFRAVGEIKNAAMQLGARGLLSGFGMEEGRVTPMFNRLNELLDQERLKTATEGRQFGHVTPEIANKLQENLIQEQLGNASLGIGDFGDLRQGTIDSLPVPQGEDPQRFRQEYRDKIEADIVRSVRIAYDVFVDTQRLAVIVARGRHLTETDAIFSDPASGPLNIYNIEDLLTEKFDIFNLHDYQFLERMKLDLAEGYIRKKPGLKLNHEQKLDLGVRLFRDLFAAPDFFSSSWRIKGIVDSINERFIARFVDENATGQDRENQIANAKNKAKDMALFLRLKGAGDEEQWQITKRDAWERVAKYRPEEVIRLFRERAPGTPELEGRLTELFNNGIFTANNVANYDQFKEKYGGVLRIIRDKGYQDFRPINIAEDGFNQDEREILTKYFGNDTEADNLIQMFNLMTQFSNASIDDLLNNNRFEDIYTRTINVDDAILSELEKNELIYRDANGNTVRKTGFTPLSSKWAADQGGDALFRNWSDTENAVNAAKELIGFVKSEKEQDRLKHAIDCAEANSQYNGQMGRAKVMRYTFGTFLLMSKKDIMWEIIGLNKLPLRIPMSEIEKIYGPSGKPLSRGEIRQKIDEISTLLMGSLKKDVREGRVTPEEYKENLKEVKAYEEDLVVQSENTKRDFIKIKGLSLFLYILLAMLGEGQRVVKESGKGTLK